MNGSRLSRGPGACPNGTAMLFTGAKVTHLNVLPQGQPERESRVVGMVEQMEADQGHDHAIVRGAQGCPFSFQLTEIEKGSK